MLSPRGYRLLPHTADIRLEVRGRDLPELFAASIEALFSVIVDRRLVRPATARTWKVSAKGPAVQLSMILQEALLLFSPDLFLVRTARVTIRKSEVETKVWGEPYDPLRHAASREIKAVTAHGMTVDRNPGGCVARFIVDV